MEGRNRVGIMLKEDIVEEVIEIGSLQLAVT